MITLVVNGKQERVDAAPDLPLLWAIREDLRLTGTKYGCGMALCGACTVHLDGAPIRSCVTPISAAVGKKITTIEAVGAPPSRRPPRGGGRRPHSPPRSVLPSGRTPPPPPPPPPQPKPHQTPTI